jgi:hypothetical protein
MDVENQLCKLCVASKHKTPQDAVRAVNAAQKAHETAAHHTLPTPETNSLDVVARQDAAASQDASCDSDPIPVDLHLLTIGGDAPVVSLTELAQGGNGFLVDGMLHSPPKGSIPVYSGPKVLCITSQVALKGRKRKEKIKITWSGSCLIYVPGSPALAHRLSKAMDLASMCVWIGNAPAAGNGNKKKRGHYRSCGLGVHW